MNKQNQLIVTLIILLIGLLQISCSFNSNIKQYNQQDVYIGVYTQPAHFHEYTADKYQYILDSNVKFVHEHGAKAVGIPFNGTESQLTEIFNSVNGILFTGGGLDLDIDTPIDYTNVEYNVFTKNAEFLLNLAKKANDEGTFFPVWGNCQGFELMLYIQGGYDPDTLQHIDDQENVTRPGIFNMNSRLFKGMDNFKIQKAKQNSYLYYFHEWAVFKSFFNNNSGVYDFYDINGRSTNTDNPSQGTQFIASVEAKEYPFIALQFHPEYTMFDDNKNTNKSEESLEFNSYFCEYFYQLAKKCPHTFDYESKLLKKAVIDNFEVAYFPGDFFEHIYFVKNSDFGL